MNFVHVLNLICVGATACSRFAGTVEERILALQDTKRKIVSAAFGDEGGGSQQASRLTKEDLHYLFTGQR